MLRRADRHRIDVRGLEQLAIVGEGFDRDGLVAALLPDVVILDIILRVLQALGIQVAHGHDAGDIVFDDAWHIHLMADAAAADLGDVDFLARRICAKHRGRHEGWDGDGARGAYHRGLEELSSG